jgi:hypothetical protein
MSRKMRTRGVFEFVLSNSLLKRGPDIPRVERRNGEFSYHSFQRHNAGVFTSAYGNDLKDADGRTHPVAQTSACLGKVLLITFATYSGGVQWNVPYIPSEAAAEPSELELGKCEPKLDFEVKKDSTTYRAKSVNLMYMILSRVSLPSIFSRYSSIFPAMRTLSGL